MSIPPKNKSVIIVKMVLCLRRFYNTLIVSGFETAMRWKVVLQIIRLIVVARRNQLLRGIRRRSIGNHAKVGGIWWQVVKVGIALRNGHVILKTKLILK